MTQTLTLALAQLNLWVGDVEGNVGKIIAAAVKARDELKADLIACPELSLIGYPPDDLLLRSGLPKVIEQGVQRLLEAVRGITLVVGLPEYDAGRVGGALYNAAYVIRDGHVIARYRKQQLPNYGVFDECRHFTPGFTPCVFSVNGHKIGLTICEDAWFSQPSAQAREAGAELLLNINASPWNRGKRNQRQRVLDTRVAETGLPMAYVNCVGGQDEVVFDGDSRVLRADGSVAFAAPQFEEGVYAVTMQAGRFEGETAPLLGDEAETYAALWPPPVTT